MTGTLSVINLVCLSRVMLTTTFVFIVLVIVISHAREASIALPEKSKEGDDVSLYCQYDGRGARLHQVRWFLNGQEFYRYVRVGRPQQIDYSLPGMKLDLLASDGEKVRLLQLSVLSSGIYRCEVTTEDSYQPLVGEGVMTVVSGKHGSSSGKSRTLAVKTRISGKSRSFLPTIFELIEKFVTFGALFFYLYSMVTLFQAT